MASLGPHCCVWASVAVRGPPLPCVGLCSLVWASVAVRGPPLWCVGLCCRAWASVAVRGPLFPCVGLRCGVWAPVAVRGPLLPCVGLRCRVWAFSSFGERGLPQLWGAGCFSCGGARVPGTQASALVPPGPHSAGSIAVVPRLGRPTACGIFQDQDRTQVLCAGGQTLNRRATSKAP